MPLEIGTKLEFIVGPTGFDGGGTYAKVEDRGVTHILVGKEAGPMGWFATAEVYAGDTLVTVIPLHMAERYNLCQEA